MSRNSQARCAWRGVYVSGMPEYESVGAESMQALYNALFWAADISGSRMTDDPPRSSIITVGPQRAPWKLTAHTESITGSCRSSEPPGWSVGGSLRRLLPAWRA